MFDKSGKGTLDTLKEILNDINDHCHMKERENDMHSGSAILANSRDKMSDRASTEKNFNALFQNFRSKFCR